jgi:hypothetical protein
MTKIAKERRRHPNLIRKLQWPRQTSLFHEPFSMKKTLWGTFENGIPSTAWEITQEKTLRLSELQSNYANLQGNCKEAP